MRQKHNAKKMYFRNLEINLVKFLPWLILTIIKENCKINKYIYIINNVLKEKIRGVQCPLPIIS